MLFSHISSGSGIPEFSGSRGQAPAGAGAGPKDAGDMT